MKLKKLGIIISIICLFVIPINIKAYTFNDTNIDEKARELLNELSASWPSNLEQQRIDVIKKAATLINRGIIYASGGADVSSMQVEYPSRLDCSDFVAWAFNQSGITDVDLDWNTTSFGTTDKFIDIDENELLPGDIALNLLRKPDESVQRNNHMAIYIGKMNGTNFFIHSTSSGSDYLKQSETGPQIREGNGNLKFFRRYNAWSSATTNSGTSVTGNNGSTDDPFMQFPPINSGDFKCETIFINSDGTEKELKKILDGLFLVMQIAAPVIALALSIVDYTKAILNSDSAKKANAKIIKRVAIAIVLLMLPFLLDLLFDLFGLYDISRCTIG